MRYVVTRPSPWILLAALLGLAGCATPQMQSTVRFVPPSDPAGRACVAECDTARLACQAQCQASYARCIKTLDAEVEAKYTDALRQYEADLRRYASELQQYQFDMRLGWVQAWPVRHPYRRLYYGYEFWPYPPLPVPTAPVAPTREAVRAQLEKTRCQADCGCLPAYDGCFVGCGGERITETRCIRNCPSAP